MGQKPGPRKKSGRGGRGSPKAGVRPSRGRAAGARAKRAGVERGRASARKGAAVAKGLDESTRDWLHRTLLNEVREMVLVFGADGRVLSVNEAGREILGYSDEELRALPNLAALVVLEDRAFAEERFATLFSTGEPQTKTLRLMRKDGAVRWVEWRCGALRGQGGRVRFVVGVGLDVTAARASQEELRRSERSTRAVLEAIPDLLFRMDADGRYLEVQARPSARLMLPTEGFLGRRARDVLPAEVSRPTMEAIDRALRSGETQTFEYGVPVGAPERWYEVRVAAAGLAEVVVLVREVTESRRAQARIEEAERRYRSIVEACTEGLWLTNAEWVTVFVNPRMAELLGVTREAMLGRSVLDLLTGEEREAALPLMRSLEAGHPLRTRFRFRHSSGREVVTEVSATPTFGEDGRFAGSLAIITDVTTRAQAEGALQREQRLFLAGPVVAWRWRAAAGWPVEYVSANVSQFGYTVADFVEGRVSYEGIVHPEDRARVTEEVRAHTAVGRTNFEQHYRIRRADGRYIHIQDFTSVVRGERGEVTHYEGYIFDDTSRLETAAALAESQRRLSLLVKRSPIGVIVWDQDRRAREWNPAAAEIFGHSEAEALGMPVSAIVPERFHGELAALGDLLYSGRAVEPVRRPNVTRDGREIVCEWHNTPLIDDDGRVMGVASMVRDVTAEVMAQTDLEQREEDLRLITDALPALIGYVDEATLYRFCNAQHGRWLGVPPERVRGRTLEEVLGADVVRAARDRWASVRAGRTARFEAQVRTLAGVRDMDLTLVPHMHDGAYQGVYVLALDVTDRKVVERELSDYRARLEQLVEKRTAELEAERARVRRAEQLASLGTLAGGLGHDMNNMLLPMRCAIDELSVSASEPWRQQVESLKRSIEFLGQLSADLLLLASAPEDAVGSRARTDLRVWWARDGATLAAAGRGVDVQIDLPARLPPVAVPQPQLSRAILNLVVNAAEATGGRGHVKIWAREEGEQVLVGVTDDGPGMPSDVAERALDPFFTTKKRGISTGLGLSIVHAVAKAAGGSVRLLGGGGAGATVCLALPQARPMPGVSPASQAENGVPRTARLSVADERVAGYIAALLSVRSIRVERSRASEGPGTAALWITDPDDAVDAALSSREPSRKVIVVGGALPEWRERGAILVGDPSDIAAIAAALR